MRQIIRLVLISWISFTLVACAGTNKNILGNDVKTMKTVYDEKFGSQIDLQDEQPKRPIHDGDGDLKGYTRNAHNELQAIFPLLPNPTLVMYIYPHLTAGGLEVPGYSTRIKMYRQDHYALPGELGGWE